VRDAVAAFWWTGKAVELKSLATPEAILMAISKRRN